MKTKIKALSTFQFNRLFEKHEVTKNVTSLQEYNYVIEMYEKIHSCINGNPHGDFITAICDGNRGKAEMYANDINDTFLNLYFETAELLKQIK